MVSTKTSSFRIPAQVVSTGLPALLVPVADAAAVAGARRDAAGVARACAEAGAADLYLFALTEGGAKARMFDPGIGIGEGPATGSAAGPLGAYLAARAAGGMPGRIAVRQGEEIGRPSVLLVEVRPDGPEWSVIVGGESVPWPMAPSTSRRLLRPCPPTRGTTPWQRFPCSQG